MISVAVSMCSLSFKFTLVTILFISSLSLELICWTEVIEDFLVPRLFSGTLAFLKVGDVPFPFLSFENLSYSELYIFFMTSEFLMGILLLVSTMILGKSGELPFLEGDSP